MSLNYFYKKKVIIIQNLIMNFIIMFMQNLIWVDDKVKRKLNMMNLSIKQIIFSNFCISL